MSIGMKIGQPRFLDRNEVLQLHSFSLEVYGGAAGFVNEGAFESAIAQPLQAFAGQYAHDFPFGMAAAYGFHLAMNHAFRDGNKRVAFAAMETFLHMNGWTLTLADPEPAVLMLQMIEERRDKAWLAGRLREVCRERPSFELRDFFVSVRLDHLVDRLRAIGANPTNPNYSQEMLALLREAGTAVPAVWEVHALASRQAAAGQVGAADQTMQLALQFAALYRIAEDMGYEW